VRIRKPELKQFADLVETDFQRHPVWIQCHIVDYDEPWHDETDEETFRPWTGETPADPSDGMLLVRATGTLPDGTRFPGVLTPASEADDLGSLQPHLFVAGTLFGFWGGGVGVSEERRAAFYAALRRGSDDTFPVRFEADNGLCRGVTSVEVLGFYKLSGERVVVER
jgi:hypothetical protein